VSRRWSRNRRFGRGSDVRERDFGIAGARRFTVRGHSRRFPTAGRALPCGILAAACGLALFRLRPFDCAQDRLRGRRGVTQPQRAVRAGRVGSALSPARRVLRSGRGWRTAVPEHPGTKPEQWAEKAASNQCERSETQERRGQNLGPHGPKDVPRRRERSGFTDALGCHVLLVAIELAGLCHAYQTKAVEKLPRSCFLLPKTARNELMEDDAPAWLVAIVSARAKEHANDRSARPDVTLSDRNGLRALLPDAAAGRRCSTLGSAAR